MGDILMKVVILCFAVCAFAAEAAELIPTSDDFVDAFSDLPNESLKATPKDLLMAVEDMYDAETASALRDYATFQRVTRTLAQQKAGSNDLVQQGYKNPIAKKAKEIKDKLVQKGMDKVMNCAVTELTKISDKLG